MKRTPLRTDPAKTRAWQDRSRVELGRTPMPKVNRERRARLFAEQFHSEAFVSWVHSLACTVPSCRRTEIEAAHVTSRGAGGKWDSIIPLCTFHHRRLHEWGRLSMEAEWGVELEWVADAIQLRWAAWTADRAQMRGPNP